MATYNPFGDRTTNISTGQTIGGGSDMGGGYAPGQGPGGNWVNGQWQGTDASINPATNAPYPTGADASNTGGNGTSANPTPLTNNAAGSSGNGATTGVGQGGTTPAGTTMVNGVVGKIDPITGNFTPLSSGGSTGSGADSIATKNNPFTYSWLQNGTMTNPSPSGPQTSGVNAQEWATPGSAANIAQQFGGNQFQNTGGAFGSFSNPQEMIGFGNGNTINAGLAGDALSKYGSAPGSLGNFMVNRDIQGPYSQYAQNSPWNNTSDQGANAIYAQNAQRQQQGLPMLGLDGQPLAQGMQPYSAQGGAIPNQAQGTGSAQPGSPNFGQQSIPGLQNNGMQNPMTQLSMLIPLMQLLFGGGGAGASGGQRPPALPANYNGYPFFSQFA